MTALVVAEHNNQELKPVTLNTVTAALELDQERTYFNCRKRLFSCS
jgi:electron transfer flavoprotein alpha subunit